jgi:hypothetical protein
MGPERSLGPQGCSRRPAVVGIHIAASANRSTEELSSRYGRVATHPLVQPQGRELRVEGGTKDRRGRPLATWQLPLHQELLGHLLVLAAVGCDHHGSASASGRASLRRRAQPGSGSLTVGFQLHSGAVFFCSPPYLFWIDVIGEAGYHRPIRPAQHDHARIVQQVERVTRWQARGCAVWAHQEEEDFAGHRRRGGCI